MKENKGLVFWFAIIFVLLSVGYRVGRWDERRVSVTGAEIGECLDKATHKCWDKDAYCYEMTFRDCFDEFMGWGIYQEGVKNERESYCQTRF